MKNAFLATLLLAATSLTASAATITLVPSNATPFAGETFTVDLLVSANTQELLGFGLNYSLSNAGISFSSFAVNPFFGDELGLDNPQVSAINFDGTTAASVRLVTFTLVANFAGSSSFSVSSDLNDFNQGLFILNANPATDLTRQVDITVLPASSTPEPGTFGFATLAVAGIFYAARRRVR